MNQGDLRLTLETRVTNLEVRSSWVSSLHRGFILEIKKPPKGGFFMPASYELLLCGPQNAEGPVEPALRETFHFVRGVVDPTYWYSKKYA